MIKTMDKLTKHQMLLITFLATGGSGLVLAAEYVPPPAGPYKPAVVVSGTQNSAIKGSGKVYKFPSEDLMRAEAPAMPEMDSTRNEPDRTVQNEGLRANLEGQKNATKAPVYSLQNPANVQNPVNSYALNPWAAGVGTTRSQSVAPPHYQGAQQPGQAWYPQYGYPQQNPYAYGYPNYYGNSNNSANAPFSNMPSPWTMMPMQPFSSGR